MEGNVIALKHIEAFREHLQREEKSAVTVEKYLRDARAFFVFVQEKFREKNHVQEKFEQEDYGPEGEITKELAVAYKKSLEERGYAVRSINSMLASVNSLLEFLGLAECKVKNLRCQRQTYCAEEKELSKAEYLRLLEASKKQEQLNLVLQTICGTGIRVSELKYFTVEAVRHGEVLVRCKSKIRTILVPRKLKNFLLKYAKKRGISAGAIFVTRSGRPLDRSNIWAQMKRLCVAANVNPSKVFPHNLRKLFARTFYGIEKDIAKLADILGHGNIETTRIYIMTTGVEHRRKIEQLGLVV